MIWYVYGLDRPREFGICPCGTRADSGKSFCLGAIVRNNGCSLAYQRDFSGGVLILSLIHAPLIRLAAEPPKALARVSFGNYLIAVELPTFVVADRLSELIVGKKERTIRQRLAFTWALPCPRYFGGAPGISRLPMLDRERQH
jgi:hypothetical protein